jgi:hypothetical protein
MQLTDENRSTLGKTCPSATLFTTNPTRTDPGSNPGLRGACSVSVRTFASTDCRVLLRHGEMVNVRSGISTGNLGSQKQKCSVKFDTVYFGRQAAIPLGRNDRCRNSRY